MCAVLGTRLCGDLGTVSNLVKNSFNKVRQLPRWGRAGGTSSGEGGNPEGPSCVSTPASVLGPLGWPPARWSWAARSRGLRSGPAPGGQVCRPPGQRSGPGARGGLGLSAPQPVRVCALAAASQQPGVRVLVSFPL